MTTKLERPKGISLSRSSWSRQSLASRCPSIPYCRPIELENQVQCLMEAHLAPTQPTHVNKITTACEICSGPHDTQYCIEDPEQAFVKYASSRTDEARAGTLPTDFGQEPHNCAPPTSPVLAAVFPTIDPQCSAQIQSSINGITIHPNQQGDSRDDKTEGNEEERKDSPGNIHYNSSTPPDPSVSFITEKSKGMTDSGKKEPERTGDAGSGAI
ncbi:hypothetical protein Tco_1026501 [Tanacetum coccineum]